MQLLAIGGRGAARVTCGKRWQFVSTVPDASKQEELDRIAAHRARLRRRDNKHPRIKQKNERKPYIHSLPQSAHTRLGRKRPTEWRAPEMARDVEVDFRGAAAAMIDFKDISRGVTRNTRNDGELADPAKAKDAHWRMRQRSESAELVPEKATLVLSTATHLDVGSSIVPPGMMRLLVADEPLRKRQQEKRRPTWVHLRDTASYVNERVLDAEAALELLESDDDWTQYVDEELQQETTQQHESDLRDAKTSAHAAFVAACDHADMCAEAGWFGDAAAGDFESQNVVNVRDPSVEVKAQKKLVENARNFTRRLKAPSVDVVAVLRLAQKLVAFDLNTTRETEQLKKALQERCLRLLMVSAMPLAECAMLLRTSGVFEASPVFARLADILDDALLRETAKQEGLVPLDAVENAADDVDVLEKISRMWSKLEAWQDTCGMAQTRGTTAHWALRLPMSHRYQARTLLKLLSSSLDAETRRDPNFVTPAAVLARVAHFCSTPAVAWELNSRTLKHSKEWARARRQWTRLRMLPDRAVQEAMRWLLRPVSAPTLTQSAVSAASTTWHGTQASSLTNAEGTPRHVGRLLVPALVCAALRDGRREEAAQLLTRLHLHDTQGDDFKRLAVHFLDETRIAPERYGKGARHPKGVSPSLLSARIDCRVALGDRALAAELFKMGTTGEEHTPDAMTRDIAEESTINTELRSADPELTDTAQFWRVHSNRHDWMYSPVGDDRPGEFDLRRASLTTVRFVLPLIEAAVPVADKRTLMTGEDTEVQQVLSEYFAELDRHRHWPGFHEVRQLDEKRLKLHEASAAERDLLREELDELNRLEAERQHVAARTEFIVRVPAAPHRAMPRKGGVRARSSPVRVQELQNLLEGQSLDLDLPRLTAH